MHETTATYTARYRAPRRRWLAAIHPVRMVPHVIGAAAVSAVATPATALSWLSALVCDRVPPAVGRTVAHTHRHFARVNGSLYLLAEQAPPPSADRWAPHPVRLVVPPAHSRVRVDRQAALRCAANAPAIISLNLALGALVVVGAGAAWPILLTTGRMPERLHRTIAFGTSYHARSAAYLALLTRDPPPLRDRASSPRPTPATLGDRS